MSMPRYRSAPASRSSWQCGLHRDHPFEPGLELADSLLLRSFVLPEHVLCPRVGRYLTGRAGSCVFSSARGLRGDADTRRRDRHGADGGDASCARGDGRRVEWDVQHAGVDVMESAGALPEETLAWMRGRAVAFFEPSATRSARASAPSTWRCVAARSALRATVQVVPRRPLALRERRRGHRSREHGGSVAPGIE